MIGKIIKVLLTNLFLFSTPGFAITLKLAAISPEDSSWADYGKRFAQCVAEETSDKLRIQWFLGGTMGDEPAELKKVRLRQLHGAAFTLVGLGLITPDIRVLELPFLFQNEKEVDYLLESMQEEFSEMFRQKGFELLGFLEVGLVRFYFTRKIETLQDFLNTRMFYWTGDPIGLEALKGFGFTNIVPLQLPDVYTALSTGMVEGVYGTDYAVVGLQWFTQLKYITPWFFSYTPAAVLVSTWAYNKLDPKQQKVLKECWKKFEKPLMKIIRRDNRTAYQEMLNRGLKPLELKENVYNQLLARGKEVWKKVSGSLLSSKIVTMVKEKLSRIRKSNAHYNSSAQ